MVTVIGVRFRKAGKIYYFNPGKYKVKKGQHVIVETVRGVEFGSVVLGPKKIEDEQLMQPLKTVIRIANANDYKIEEQNREKEKRAYKICQEKIQKHQLAMKLVDGIYL